MLDAHPIDDDAPLALHLDEPGEDTPEGAPAAGIDAFVTRLRKAIGDKPVDRVAREAGIHRETLRVLLRGGVRKRGMYSDTIDALAKVCGVSSGWLAFGEGKP